MAGNLAKSVNASVLVLNHISEGVRDLQLKALLDNASAACDGISKVTLSYDFMELCVPREGFKFEEHLDVKDNLKDETSSNTRSFKDDTAASSTQGFGYWWNKIW